MKRRNVKRESEGSDCNFLLSIWVSENRRGLTEKNAAPNFFTCALKRPRIASRLPGESACANRSSGSVPSHLSSQLKQFQPPVQKQTGIDRCCRNHRSHLKAWRSERWKVLWHRL